MSKCFLFTPLMSDPVLWGRALSLVCTASGWEQHTHQRTSDPSKSPEKDNNRRLRWTLRLIYANKSSVPEVSSSHFLLISCFVLRQKCSLSFREQIMLPLHDIYREYFLSSFKLISCHLCSVKRFWLGLYGHMNIMSLIDSSLTIMKGTKSARLIKL